MSSVSHASLAEKPLRKLDLAQVSLSLQDRLGLAKVRYQRIRQGTALQNGSHLFNRDLTSDSSSDVERSRYETPFTSSPLPNPIFSRELPRSARNKHAAMFDPTMQPVPAGSRKRERSDSVVDHPAKAARTSWKSSYRLPESSPSFHRHHATPYHGASRSFASENATIPEDPSDDEKDPELPANHVSSSAMISSSPPRTPPPNRARLARSSKGARTGEDGADLLLFLANSPTPAHVNGNNATNGYPPSTPPSQHAVLPSLTPTPGGGISLSFGTPTQQFNFADFVNVTPSPAQVPWGGRTPRPSRTPLITKKRLNFDHLAPPTGSPRMRNKDSGIALELGEELRP